MADRHRALTALTRLTQKQRYGPGVGNYEYAESTSTTNELTEPLFSFAPVGRPASRTAGDAQSSLDIVLSNIGFESISDARFAPGPTGSRDPWLYVEVNVPSVERGQATRAEWEANVLFGAVAERTATGPNLADALGGMTVVHTLPDGSSQQDFSHAMGEMAAGQVFRSHSSEDGVLVDDALKVLDSFGLTPVSVSILRPLDGALVVTATMEPGDTLRLYELVAELTENYSKFEGYYLKLRLPDGQPIAKVGSAIRAGVGVQWVQPGFETVLGTRPPPAGP